MIQTITKILFTKKNFKTTLQIFSCVMVLFMVLMPCTNGGIYAQQKKSFVPKKFISATQKLSPSHKNNVTKNQKQTQGKNIPLIKQQPSKSGWIRSAIEKNNATVASGYRNLANQKRSQVSKSPLLSGDVKNAQKEVLFLLYSEPNNSFGMTPSRIFNVYDKSTAVGGIVPEMTKDDKKVLQSLFSSKKKFDAKKVVSRYYVSLDIGYGANFNGTLFPIDKYSDTPMQVSLSNVSASFVPITLGVGKYASMYGASYGLEFTYYLSSPSVSNKTTSQTTTYGGTNWLFASGSKPQVNLFSAGFNFTYFFKNIVIAGRDIYKLFFSATPKLYYMTYSDIQKVTTSLNSTYTDVIEGGDNALAELNRLSAYHEDFKRTFDPILLVGANVGLGFTARANYHLIFLFKLGGELTIPIQSLSYGTIENKLKNNQANIPWTEAPKSINITSGYMIDLKIGLQYVF